MGNNLNPPILPSFNLPPQMLPDPPKLPRPILDAPSADLPSFNPMLVPAEALKGPEGTEEEEEDDEVNALPEVQKVTIPFINREIPIPQEEIMVTAATTAAISVAATLTATSLFKQCVKVFKPLIMQFVKRIQKKFTNGDTTKKESSG
jgi:hypothetical protein|tara:strand:+ start:1225 stop:1668 length:444 start_codon:yes stop_codon:yes gene_type:complete